MPTKTLEQVREGMVTEEPVRDGTGNVVLAEGIQLTNTIIALLKRRGVNTVHVSGGKDEKNQSDDGGLSEEERLRMRRRIDEQVDRVFVGQKDRLMLDIAEAAKRHLKSKIK